MSRRNNFYPRSPRGERPLRIHEGHPQPVKISIHAPREGSDPAERGHRPEGAEISIHAPREGSDSTGMVRALSPPSISIHAPREGSDLPAFGGVAAHLISIHAPREGSDWRQPTLRTGCCPFLSTLPARGATLNLINHVFRSFLISIHAPREGSDQDLAADQRVLDISIHAPREGSDVRLACLFRICRPISIHAPREGSDGGAGLWIIDNSNFYPRSPRGERQMIDVEFL